MIGMLRPLVLAPGLIFDGRSVMISLCALYFGPVAGVIAAAMAAGCRMYLGGVGTGMGLSVIASSTIIGCLFYASRRSRAGERSATELLVFGLLVQGTMLAMTAWLPAGTRLDTLQRIGIPVLITYPLATVLIGKILSGHQARRRYVQDLWESREEFRTTLYSIGDAVITTDERGIVRHVNPVAEHLMGRPRTEASGQPLNEVFHIVDEVSRQQVENPVNRVLKEGHVVGLANHTLLISADGAERPIADSGAPIRDAQGRITGVVLVFRDQTEERAREEALRENEVIFSEFMANSPIYVFFKDDAIRSIRLSANFESLLGRPLEDILGKTMDEVFPSPLSTSMIADDKRVLEEGRPLVVDEEFNGRYYTTIKFPIHIRGKARYLAGYTIDITEQKAAEAALTRRLEYERAAAACMRLMVDVSDMHSRLDAVVATLREAVHASRAYIFQNDIDPRRGTFTSQTHEAVANGIAPQLDNPMLQHVHFASDAPAIASALQARHHVSALASELSGPDRAILEQQGILSVLILPIFSGQEFWGFLGFDDCVQARRWDDDDIRLLQVVADGIGAAALRLRVEQEHEHLELQLRHAHKMEAIGRLAGGVAHDFNNMLSVILGHAEIARDELSASDPMYDNIVEIIEAARRSADLTRQLLAFARKQTIVPRVVNLNDTIESMLKMLGRLIGEEIGLQWKPGQDLWNVRLDPAQLDQVLVNLVVNARDAIDGMGAIVIETSNVQFDEDWCESHPDFEIGEFVMLAVRDDGSGMNDETLRRLFEPFFTTKELGKGTGLGLATVYGIVKQNGGVIHVESQPGAGTSVQLYLPRHKQPQEAAPDMPRALRTGHETVLLIEDEHALLELAQRFLTKLGYRVIASDSPAEAIELARRHDGTIHLLMTDVIMPEMSGIDVWKLLVEMRPDLKCLFVSGYTADFIAQSTSLDEGFHFLPKPFSVETLAAKLREALEA